MCLPTPEDTNFDSNTMFQVSGWGSTGWDETSNQSISSPKLKDINVKWATDEACREYWETKDKRTPAVYCITDRMVCVNGIKDDQHVTHTPCHGDSGGPVTWQETPNSPVKLIGLVSFGPGDGHDGWIDGPFVAARVSAVLDWIHGVI